MKMLEIGSLSRVFKFRNILPLVVIICICWPVNLLAETLDVCLDSCSYSSLQTAIDVSSTGDIIRVVQGIYDENISIVEKENLTIAGSYKSNDFTTRDSLFNTSVIDCRGVTNTVYISNSRNIAIDGFTIKNGQAVDGAGVKIVADGQDIETTVTLSNNTITENIATYGGGIAVAADNFGSCLLDMSNTTISNNSATYGGGLAANAENSASARINMLNNKITNNVVDRYNSSTFGGGVYVRTAGDNSVMVFDSDNDDISDNKAGGNGGGLAFYTSEDAGVSLSIKNGIISNNDSGFEGGGVYFYSQAGTPTFSIVDSQIVSNYSNSDGGGGVYIRNSGDMSLDLIGDTIFHNSSGNDSGGGVNIDNRGNSDFNLLNNKIYYNGGLWSGGNIYITNTSSISLEVIGNNISEGSINNNGSGGGLYLLNSGEISGNFKNNLFYQNGLYHRPIYFDNNWGLDKLGNSYNGGALSIINVSSGLITLEFINNTITDNYTNSAFYINSSNDGTSINFINGIIFGNQYKDFYNNLSNAIIDISYTDIGEPFGSYNDYGGNINTDPIFVDTIAQDYNLLSTSPCIDAGTSINAPEFDINGIKRPLGLEVDMGAFETDDQLPVVTNFTLPDEMYGLTVNIESFDVLDNDIVSGYLLSEDDLSPELDDTSWSIAVPMSYTFTTYGAKNLYAFVKDATGNISNCAVASTVMLTSPLDDTTVFVQQVYQDFLNRDPDAGGSDYWVNAIDVDNVPRAQLVEDFLNSAEFGQTVSPVTRLYFAYFNRIPDYGGLMYWINAYSTGTPLADVSNVFAGSAEFTDTYGNLSNEEFVTLVYQNVLDRNPDAGGLSYWTGVLDRSEQTRGQVMIGFSESTEYIALMDSQIYVTMTYIGLLRRSPDQGGFTYWVGIMDGGGSGLNLIEGFLSSGEYAARF